MAPVPVMWHGSCSSYLLCSRCLSTSCLLSLPTLSPCSRGEAAPLLERPSSDVRCLVKCIAKLLDGPGFVEVLSISQALPPWTLQAVTCAGALADARQYWRETIALFLRLLLN